MNSPFTTINIKKPKRSKRDLSHFSIRTDTFGRITPVNFEEVVGDTMFIQNTKNYIIPRPLFAPAFAKIFVLTRSFFVPNRLVQHNYEEYYAQTDDSIKQPYTTIRDICTLATAVGNEAYDPLINGSLGDFIGIPTLVKQGAQYNGENVVSSQIAADVLANGSAEFLEMHVNIMKLLCYHRVWLDWYADQNYDSLFELYFELLEHLDEVSTYPHISASSTLTLTVGGNTGTYNVLSLLFEFHRACGPKDYFMSALPSQQSGNPVPMPIGSAAPVVMKTQSGSPFVAGANMLGGSGSGTNNEVRDYDPVDNPLGFWFTDNHGGQSLVHLFADLSNAVGGNVIEFRTALAAQRFEEKYSRTGGKRYKERLLALYGVAPKDEYVQRSQYIGGNVQDVSIDTIFSTAETDSSEPRAGLLGSYAGRAYSAGESGYKGYYTQEPGFFITLQSIVPMPLYINGFKKDLIRDSFFEKLIPDFVCVGEQPIKACEYHVPWGDSHGFSPSHIFGYTPHYSDWCKHDDEVHGDFRGNLGYWHTAQSGDLFDSSSDNELSLPILQQYGYAGAMRLFAVKPSNTSMWSDLPFICQVKFDSKVILPLPKNLSPRI